jgi:hypothetical protein
LFLNRLLADRYGHITRDVFYWVCGINKVGVVDGKIR